MRVLAATPDGLYAIDGDGNAKQVAPGEMNAIAHAPGGATLCAVDGHDVVRVRGDEIETVGHTGETLTCIAATRDDVFAGTVGAHLLHLVGGTLARVETFEELDGRETWTQPWGAPGDARSFATDGDRALYVNVHVGGVLRTHDAGETWVQTIDPEVDVHQIVRAPDGWLFAATGAAGLAFSADDGATWEYMTEGLHGTYARAVAVVPDGVVVSVSTGPHTSEGAVYRLRRGATTFERSDRGIPVRFEGNIDSHCIAAAGPVVVCAAPDRAVYVSVDAGASWRTLATGLPEITAVLVDA
jgi:hypothetical protein